MTYPPERYYDRSERRRRDRRDFCWIIIMSALLALAYAMS